MLKRVLFLGAALLLAAYPALAQLSLPTAVPKPTATVTRFALDSLTLRDVTFAIEVTVKNPYAVALSFDSLALNFAVEGQKVFSTKTKDGMSIPANGQKANTFKVTLDYAGVIGLVKNYAEKDWLKTVITGTLVLPLPKLPGLPPDLTFTYNLEKKIPALKPTVSIRDFTVKAPDPKEVEKALKAQAAKFDLNEVVGFLGDLISGKKPKKALVDPTTLDVPFSLSFTLALENSSKAALSFKGLDYSLLVDGVDLLKGQTTNVKVQGPVTLVTIETQFSSKKLGAALQKTFAARKGSFQILGQAEVQVPKEIRDTPVPLAFDEKGSFAF